MHRFFLAVSFFILVSVPVCIYAQTENVNVSNLVSFDGEPSLAVNPQNPANIIAGWMRLRLDGKIWIAVRSSFDGGATWSPIQFLPHMQPDYGSADVSIAFHRSGLAYLLYIDFRMVPDTVGGVYIAHSTDGGLRWSEPREAVSTVGRPDLPLDRPWVVVDNSGGAKDGTVYMSVMSAYWYPGQHRIYTRSSSDSGATWSPLNRLDSDEYSPGLVTKSYGAISVGGDGKIYTAYISYDTSATPFLRMYAAVSSDAGATWQRAVIANVALWPNNFGYAQGYCIAADPVRPGHAVVTWIDERYGDSDVLLKRTTDGGRTWGAVVRINDDPEANGVAQDLVWASYSPTGQLAIVWRDRRIAVPGVSAPFDIYARVSPDGGGRFEPNQRLSSASSPWITLGCCNSFLGVALTGETLIAVWSDYRSNDWEIYFHSSSIAVLVDRNMRGALPELAIIENYPNPFSSSTVISYDVPAAGNVSLEIYDMLGRHYKTLVDEWRNAGRHQATFTAQDSPPGTVYYCVLSAGAFTTSKKMLLLGTRHSRR